MYVLNLDTKLYLLLYSPYMLQGQTGLNMRPKET